MKNLYFKQCALLAGVSLFAACTQTPAPVLSGYKGTVEAEKQPSLEKSRKTADVRKASWPFDQFSAQTQAERIEPAAGPSTSAAPVSPKKPAAVRAEAKPQPQLISYKVKTADTAFSLASKYDTSVKDILEQNKLKVPSDVREGMTLTIPAHSKPKISAWQQVNDMLTQAQQPLDTAADDAKKPEDSRVAAAETSPAPEAVAEAKPLADKKLADVEPAAGRAPQKDGVVLIDHQVMPGETIYRISRTYDASVFDIMTANSFTQPQDLKSGTVVKVPVNQKVATKNTADDGVVQKPLAEKPKPAADTAPQEVAVTAPRADDTADKAKDETPPAQEAKTETPDTPVKAEEIAGQSSEDKAGDTSASIVAKDKNSAADDMKAELKRGQVDPAAAHASGPVWPVKGEILRRFGEEGNGVAHTGINIAVPVGTPVLAMDRGTVLYADEGLKTYGKLVLIRHDNGMVSAYAHNGHLLVRRGEKVKKGQIIATSGASGNVDVPQLHFELRRHASALDPMRELPKL